MPKSTPSELAALRDELVAMARGRCEWSGCHFPGEHMAHLTHRRMGGSREANRIDNVAWLCRQHHDILDGRTVAGRGREVAELLRTVVLERRRRAGYAPDSPEKPVDGP